MAAAPWSLMMKLCWKEVTEPVSCGTTVDTSAFGCQLGSAMIAQRYGVGDRPRATLTAASVDSHLKHPPSPVVVPSICLSKPLSRGHGGLPLC